jgi:hypothetical protein
MVTFDSLWANLHPRDLTKQKWTLPYIKSFADNMKFGERGLGLSIEASWNRLSSPMWLKESPRTPTWEKRSSWQR